MISHNRAAAAGEIAADALLSEFACHLGNFDISGDLPKSIGAPLPTLPGRFDQVSLFSRENGEELTLVQKGPAYAGLNVMDVLSALWLHKDLQGRCWIDSRVIRSEASRVTFEVRLSDLSGEID